MASHQAVNTYDTKDAVGQREELADLISNIDPDDTPFYSDIEKKKVVSTHPEWQTDENDEPDADNAEVEGFEYEFDASDPTVRVGNYTQISDKSVIVSETLDVVDKAGRKSEVAYQMAKRGKELRMDMEAVLLANQGSVQGTKSVPGRVGGLAAWLETNALRGAGGADGGFNETTKLVDPATNGAKRAFTRAMLNEVLATAYTSGANLRTMMGAPYVKEVFATFMEDPGIAPLRTEVSASGKVTLVGSVDAYKGPHGLVAIKPNRIMASAKVGGVKGALARNIYFYDPNKVALGTLRPIQEDKDVAKTGDAKKRLLKTEYTLIVENEKAHAIIADIFGISATE